MWAHVLLQAKEQRNDTLVVLQHLCCIPACCAALACSSMYAAVLAAATTPKLQAHSPHLPSGAVSNDACDHELKLLALGVVARAAAASEACLAAAVSAGVLHSALLLACSTACREGSQTAAPWNPDQRAALRRAAWSLLAQVRACATQQHKAWLTSLSAC